MTLPSNEIPKLGFVIENSGTIGADLTTAEYFSSHGGWLDNFNCDEVRVRIIERERKILRKGLRKDSPFKSNPNYNGIMISGRPSR